MLTDKIASKYLGKKVTISNNYDPSILVAVPRDENRKNYNIESKNLPFSGVDVWHAYEFSVLTQSGIPITKPVKIKYSCESKYIIESKSLKLYFNSFNMSRFGNNSAECLELCKKIIENDLSAKLETEVNINFIENNTKKVEIFQNYINIKDIIDENNFKTDKFKEAPEILQTELKDKKEYRLMFDSLRSNCRITQQPDFGDIYIYYESEKHIKEDSILKYLCSFRSENHFHEECCEMIYKRLFDILNKDDGIMVCALYTRRGGIDISPVRYSKNCSVNDYEELTNLNIFARAGVKQ